MRGAFEGNASGGTKVSFGSFGLKSVSTSEVTSRQIEAARRAMTHYVKRGGKIWIRIFPHKPLTQKAAEVPMGSGKGNVEKFTTVIRPGAVLFEMDGIPENEAREALRLAGTKLPVQTKFVKID